MSWAQVKTFLKEAIVQDGRKVGERVILNPAKDYIQPFELPIDNPNQIVTLAAGARRGVFPLTARYDGPIEIFYVKVTVFDDQNVPVTTYDIDWLLEHPGKRIQFSNRLIPLSATSGDGGRPYVLPETIFIPPVQSLNTTFVNNDTVNERRVELVLGGVKYYPNKAPKEIRKQIWEYINRRDRTYAYWQTTDAAIVLTAGQTDAAAFFTVPDDADLEVFKLTARADAAFRTRVRDGQSDKGITGNKIHSSIMWGAHQAVAAGDGVGGSGGIFPARWGTSWLVRRSVQNQIDLDNLDANNPNTVKLVFGGRKITYVS